MHAQIIVLALVVYLHLLYFLENAKAIANPGFIWIQILKVAKDAQFQFQNVFYVIPMD